MLYQLSYTRRTEVKYRGTQGDCKELWGRADLRLANNCFPVGELGDRLEVVGFKGQVRAARC